MKKRLVILFSMFILTIPSVINSSQVVADVIENRLTQNEENLTPNETSIDDSGEKTCESNTMSKETVVNTNTLKSGSQTDGADFVSETVATKESVEHTEPTESKTVSSDQKLSSKEGGNDKEKQANSSAVGDIATGTNGTSAWVIDENGILHIYSGKLPEFPAGGDKPSWFDYGQSIKKVVLEGEVIAGTHLDYFFAYLTNVTQIDNLNFLNTNATTTMIGTFQHLPALKQIDVSGLNTASLVSMDSMFFGSSALTTLDISSWDMSNIDTWKYDTSAFPPNLNYITLGKKTVLGGYYLNAPPSDGVYGGVWINLETKARYDREKLTKTYDGDTMAGDYMWAKVPKLNVRNITLYTGESWNPQDGFISASDDLGDELYSLTNDIKILGDQVDLSYPGVYDVEYRYYYNSANTTNSVSGISKVTVKDNKTTVNVHDSTIYAGDSWQAEDNFDSALDKEGNPIYFQDLVVDESNADTSKAGTFEVKYTYDGVTSIATVTVKEKQTTVNVHDSTIYVGDNWQAEDNFDSALDKDGNDVDFSALTVDASKADTSKVGSFEVAYTYDGITSTAIITVKEKMTAVNVHDSTIYVGDNWQAEDNFDSALDKDGNPIDFQELTVDASKADTSKAGTFEVTYTYDGITSTAIITVKEKMTAVNVHDSTIYVGDNWEAEDNFDSALDKNGNDVDFSALTVDASKADTSKAGSFEVTYTYDGITSKAIITVKEKMTAVNVHDSTIYVGDSWQAEDNFDSALDKDGNSVDFQDLTVDTSKADTSKSGSFEVTYTYDGVTSKAIVTVKEKQTAVNVHDSTIYVGDSWQAEDNFDSALDKDGNNVDFSALTVDASKADMGKAGTFEVTYMYDGVTSTAIITVKEKMTAINVHDSTIYVGDKWTAKENFDNALDKAGKKVVYEDLTVDASQVDTSKAGRYEVSYSYDGITVTATVTVKEKPSQEKPANDSTHTTPEQEKENQKKITSDSKKQVTLPKTNENNSVAELVAGVIIVLLTGVIFFWKKRKVNKE
ncbi:bacterial Ig-like domain-containing protein [Enterococcus casseliflavus]|uniref:bacterial Ig-like domain-containing protein n=1 Tax=Enterococcus casseliflavus TaxID=37734 RepID=UPI00325B79CE